MNKNLIASIIFAIGCFAFFALDVPQYDLLLDVQAAIKDRQALLIDRKAMSENFKSIYNQFQQKAGDMDKLALLLPTQSYQDQILSGVQQAVTDNGLQLRSTAVGIMTGNSSDKYKKVGVTIDVSGNISSLVGLLQELEKSLRIYDVSEISIARDASNASNTSAFSMEIKATAYYSN